MPLRRLRVRPRLPVRSLTASSRGTTWARSSPLAGVVRHGHPVPLGEAVDQDPCALPAVGNTLAAPFPGGKSASNGAILPTHHATFCGNLYNTRLHHMGQACDQPGEIQTVLCALL